MRFTPILFWVFFFGGVRVAHIFSFLCFGFLCSEFVMSVTIFAYKQRLVRLYLQLFVMSYLRYLCLLANNGVQHTKKMYIVFLLLLCFVCLRLVSCVPYDASFSSSCVPYDASFSSSCVPYDASFSSSCVPYDASFSGLSIFNCPFGIL
jgi:hypothetical protein